jgi:hypothetical protein
MFASLRKFVVPLVALMAASAADCACGQNADLTMQFVVDAKLPPPQPVPAPKDFENAGLKFENVVTGPNDELANVVLYLRTKGVAVTPAAAAAAPAEVTVDNKGGRFEPHIVAVWVGKQTLLLKNSDPVGHNMNIQPLGNPPQNLLIPGGGVGNYAFTAPCTLPQPVGCNIHNWMQCFFVAKDSPYVGVSGADGKLTIKNLPAGVALEFQVWHEKVGYVEAQPAWPKGRFTQALVPGVNDLGVIKVPANLLR